MTNVVSLTQKPAELPRHYRCTECGRAHAEADLLTAPNPFQPDEQIQGCPNCANVDGFRLVCQAPECEDEATCGRPGFRGFRYAHLCGRHYGEDA